MWTICWVNLVIYAQYFVLTVCYPSADGVGKYQNVQENLSVNLNKKITDFNKDSNTNSDENYDDSRNIPNCLPGQDCATNVNGFVQDEGYHADYPYKVEDVWRTKMSKLPFIVITKQKNSDNKEDKKPSAEIVSSESLSTEDRTQLPENQQSVIKVPIAITVNDSSSAVDIANVKDIGNQNYTNGDRTENPEGPNNVEKDFLKEGFLAGPPYVGDQDYDEYEMHLDMEDNPDSDISSSVSRASITRDHHVDSSINDLPNDAIIDIVKNQQPQKLFESNVNLPIQRSIEQASNENFQNSDQFKKLKRSIIPKQAKSFIVENDVGNDEDERNKNLELQRNEERITNFQLPDNSNFQRYQEFSDRLDNQEYPTYEMDERGVNSEDFLYASNPDYVDNALNGGNYIDLDENENLQNREEEDRDGMNDDYLNNMNEEAQLPSYFINNPYGRDAPRNPTVLVLRRLINNKRSLELPEYSITSEDAVNKRFEQQPSLRINKYFSRRNNLANLSLRNIRNFGSEDLTNMYSAIEEDSPRFDNFKMPKSFTKSKSKGKNSSQRNEKWDSDYEDDPDYFADYPKQKQIVYEHHPQMLEQQRKQDMEDLEQLKRVLYVDQLNPPAQRLNPDNSNSQSKFEQKMSPPEPSTQSSNLQELTHELKSPDENVVKQPIHVEINSVTQPMNSQEIIPTIRPPRIKEIWNKLNLATSSKQDYYVDYDQNVSESKDTIDGSSAVADIPGHQRKKNPFNRRKINPSRNKAPIITINRRPSIVENRKRPEQPWRTRKIVRRRKAKPVQVGSSKVIRKTLAQSSQKSGSNSLRSRPQLHQRVKG